jgi:hypothetical protein
MVDAEQLVKPAQLLLDAVVQIFAILIPFNTVAHI